MNEVEEVKRRLDIVDVIGSYVELKQAGRNFKGLSPFKSERTPSFIVSPDKGIWHDFSAGEGGDVISFVMRMEGITFPEALELLAKKAGVTLTKKRGGGATAEKKTRLYEATEAAMKYYHLSLSKNPAALQYLTQTRAIKKTTIKHFILGYAPDSWDGLSRILQRNGFSLQELKDAGLISTRSTAAKSFDIFRSRIMFPVFDAQNRVVGFSGRLLRDDPKAAKYINTGATAIYDKSTVIYGLMQAKEAIRIQDEAILVEGNVDVLGLAQAGQENVVAVSGTALTIQQLTALARLTKNLKMCFDQDKAGLRATQRAIELSAGLDVRLSIITFEGAKDPDELVRKDAKSWKKAVETAKYAPDYLFDVAAKMFDLNRPDGKKQASSFLMPMIKALSDEIEQDHYVKRLAQTLGVDEVSVRQKLARTKSMSAMGETQPVTSAPAASAVTQTLTHQEELEQILLELLLAHSSTRVCLTDLIIDTISDRFRPIFAVLIEHPAYKLPSIVKALPEMENDVKILALKGEEKYHDLSDHDKGLEAYTQLHRIQKRNLEVNKRLLAQQIAQAEAEGNTRAAQQYLRAYQALLTEE